MIYECIVFYTAQEILQCFSVLPFAATSPGQISHPTLLYVLADLDLPITIAGMSFGALSLYGYTTKRDMSGMGSFLFMGLIGVIIGGALGYMVWKALQGLVTLGELALLYAAFNQGQGLMRTLLENAKRHALHEIFERQFQRQTQVLLVVSLAKLTGDRFRHFRRDHCGGGRSHLTAAELQQQTDQHRDGGQRDEVHIRIHDDPVGLAQRVEPFGGHLAEDADREPGAGERMAADERLRKPKLAGGEGADAEVHRGRRIPHEDVGRVATGAGEW
mgnify:CR=1 FL=1